MSMAKPAYHHGDLREALVRAALELLDEGDPDLSLRAVARRAGVSAAAPYRHYADRDALASAVAAIGYQELAVCLAAAAPEPATPEELADVAVAYVEFALQRPALFRIMFSDPCDRDSDARVAAVAAVTLYVRAAAERAFPDSDADALAIAAWALVHGLAFLHLDGKLDTQDPATVEQRVRAAVLAMLTAADTPAAGRTS
jgi:AcrR family transcriptional regulator